MRNAAIAVALAAAAVLAQDAPPRNGSIAGSVKDAGTGAPIPDVTLTVYLNSRYANGTIYMGGGGEVRSVSDAQGRYRLADLPPSTYRIFARSKDRYGPSGGRTVNLRPGQDLTGIDFLFPAFGTISGKVLDQNKEPVPGAMVFLVSKEYSPGGVGYFAKDSATANDQGEYTLRRVEPGFPYLLLARKQALMPAISDAPADPKLRKPAFVPTYYPNAPGPEAGSPVVLRAGENREGMDLRLLRAPSYCIEGTLEAGTGPASADFTIAGQELSTGVSSGGGLAMAGQGGHTGPDGKFRICGLRAGAYRLMAPYAPQPGGAPAPFRFGTLSATITDKDVTGLRLMATPGLPVSGTVSWEGAAPDPPLTATISVYLRPLRGLSFLGEGQNTARSPIPGEFSFPSVSMDEYIVSTNMYSPGVYVKDILYGTARVLYEPLRVGSALGNDLRVVLARDGGTIVVKVADKDGNPVPDIHVAILPAEAPSEAVVAARLVIGETDQNGNYSHGPLAPGKYLVLATTARMDRTVDCIGKLWAARGRAKTVELAPKGSAQATLEPVGID